MKYKTPNTIADVLALAGALPLGAQTNATTTPTDQATDETIVLSPFEVSTTKDNGYASNETLAGTRIRTNLTDVASSISVINSQFLKDVGATDSSTLLQYTTNAEVGGTRGTYAGLGNGTTLSENSILTNPGSANRVRGLASADNTRDFFVTDIPWDSYDTDRIDIQRGPNAILFGLGSPAGIVNASLHNAEFRNFANVQDRVGSYGSTRESLDANVDVIPDVLAIRVDGVWDDHKYEQKQAYQNDKRGFAAIRFDPQLFSDRSFHTSIRAKFENGNINADRPRTLPPYDSITPWFKAADTSTLEGGMGKIAIPNGYTLGSSASSFNPWLGGLANQQQPIWFIDGSSNQLYRIYGGYVNTGSLSAAGVPQSYTSSIVGQRYADMFSDLTSFSQYALNAKLPNYQYGQYRDRSLTDPSVFDFYHNLIDGPTASQFEKWNAYNLDLQQTFWDDRLGIELSYDKQKYKRGGQYLLSNPTLNIDILQNFADYALGANNAANTNVANPNYGRPFVAGGPGTGSSYESDRRYIRASVFGELRASDFFKNDFLVKLLGKQRLNGVYSNENYKTENLSWNMYANSYAYASFKTQGNPDGLTNLPPVAAIYLGPSLKNATTATNANIVGITTNVTLQDGGIYQFDSTWKPQNGVVYNAPWDVPSSLSVVYNGSPVVNPTTGLPYAELTQVSNPANYVGWNANFQDNLLRYNNGADKTLLTQAAKAQRQTRSLAGSWQGFFWDDAVVPTLGWRYDEVKSRSVTALPQGASARGALNLDPEVYKLPDQYPTNQIFKDHSVAGGVVVHLNKFLGEHDPLPFNIGLTYNNSSNFQVTDVRRNIYGTPIDNPTGTTKEYGVQLSTKDEKFSIRVTKYDTKLKGATIDGFNNSGIYNTVRDALNWRNIKVYYMGGYTWSTAGQPTVAPYSNQRYPWDPVYVDNTTGRPVASGVSTTPPSNSHLETTLEANTRRDAAIQAINDMQVYLNSKGYFQAWNYGVGPTTQSALETRGQYETNPINPDPASVYDYRTAPLMQGFAVTSDTDSKGYEFELTANPLHNWRISFNAAETKAIRSNVGGPVLDSLVTYMDTLMAGPAGDLIRFNEDYSAANELRQDWTGWRGQYTLLKLQENAATSELRKWRYNVITNYGFDRGFLKGVGVGAAYRWQDKVVIGYPTIPNAANPLLASFDLTKPYYGPSEDALDLWVSYERKITKKIDWTIQLNVYNVGKQDKLIPISVEPDGKTWAAARIAPVQEWQLTNTFSF